MERTFAVSRLSAEYCYLLLLEVCKNIYGEDFVNRCPQQLERWGFKLFRHSTYYRGNSFCTGLHLATTFDPDTCYRT